VNGDAIVTHIYNLTGFHPRHNPSGTWEVQKPSVLPQTTWDHLSAQPYTRATTIELVDRSKAVIIHLFAPSTTQASAPISVQDESSDEQTTEIYGRTGEPAIHDTSELHDTSSSFARLLQSHRLEDSFRMIERGRFIGS
jgi:hypothetical protein